MNQDGSWNQMVSDQESAFNEFLNVNDFSIDNLDFGDFDGSVGDGEFPHSQPEASGLGQESFMGAAMGVMENGWDTRQARTMEANLARAKEENVRFQQQPQQQQYGQVHRHMAVPPTPDSMEMHGRQQYPGMNPQQARVMYENYPRKQQDQMVFTPLVSPAVTPLDTQFQIPEYAVPGEYFSPLTSPAMPAQVQQRSVYSSTSEGASPSDMEIDSSPKVSSAVPANQKGKKSAKTQKSASRSVRQSPAMKPQQKRKPPTSTTLPSKDVAEIMEGFVDNASASGSRPGSSNLRISSQKTSEAGSASPEAMSEVLMPPPATPRSAPQGKSPLLGLQHGPRSALGPATPATLMRLQNNSQGGHAGHATGHGIIPGGKQSLPPLILPNILPPEIRSEDDLATPTLNPRDGSGPSQAASRTIPVSPIAPGTSSSSPVRDTSKTAAKGKKRNSSSHQSPALRPRISPSIKPLLPEGVSLSTESQALLLASKSNYQNLLEGNTLPGVTYPNALSANLTSKRTNHKLAEQGRRNRMNTALQELASLLPPSSPNGALGGSMSPPSDPTAVNGAEDKEAATPTASASGKGGNNNNNNKEGNSKASTVEMAIEFIKMLQLELGVVRGKLADAEQKLGTTDSSPSEAGEAKDDTSTSSTLPTKLQATKA